LKTVTAMPTKKPPPPPKPPQSSREAQQLLASLLLRLADRHNDPALRDAGERLSRVLKGEPA